jgi:hypothetical protein
MTLKTCLRCEWQGATNDSRCPNCGEESLYVVPSSQAEGTETPVRSRPEGRRREAASSASAASSATPSPQSNSSPSRTDAAESSGPSARSAVAIGLAALVLVITLGAWHNAHKEPLTPPASTDAAILPSPSGAPRPSPSPTPAGVGPIKRAHIGRNVQTVHGVPFSFKMTTPGWERFGNISINKSTAGSQGAEAIIFWTTFPHGVYADPCPQVLSPPVGRSSVDLASAVSTAPGTELVTGPSDVTVGRRDAKHVVLTVRENVGCAPGFFYTWHDYTWHDVDAGALWPVTRAGDMISVWIVGVQGTRFFIEAETTTQADSDLEHEIQQIIGSIRFDWSDPHHRWPW